MTTKITNAWLRRRIERDPDVDTDAGLPITKPEVLQAFVGEKRAARTVKVTAARESLVLETLLRQLRRRDGVDVSRLAAAIRVPEEELSAIERDRTFMPKPRTIHQLALHYKIPPRALLKLSAAAEKRDRELDEVAVRFAASSDGVLKLTRDEEKRLNDFVKYLRKYKECASDHGNR